MADEQTPGTNSDVAAAIAGVTPPAVKKQRAPRVKKVAAEAKAKSSPSQPAKVSDARKKRTGNGAEVTPAAEPVAAKRQRSNAAAKKQAAVAVSAPASAGDEMAELLQLEEENKRLRKILAEKLRAENADLRKKLGLA